MILSIILSVLIILGLIAITMKLMDKKWQDTFSKMLLGLCLVSMIIGLCLTVKDIENRLDNNRRAQVESTHSK